jgi:hypothetical protein
VKGDIQKSIARLHNFAFVGLVEKWDRSICLFSIMFDAPCRNVMFHKTHVTNMKKSNRTIGREQRHFFLMGTSQQECGFYFSLPQPLFHSMRLPYRCSIRPLTSLTGQSAIQGRRVGRPPLCRNGPTFWTWSRVTPTSLLSLRMRGSSLGVIASVSLTRNVSIRY